MKNKNKYNFISNYKKQHFTSFDFEEYYYFQKIDSISYKGKVLEIEKTETKKNFLIK